MAFTPARTRAERGVPYPPNRCWDSPMHHGRRVSKRLVRWGGALQDVLPCPCTGEVAAFIKGLFALGLEFFSRNPAQDGLFSRLKVLLIGGACNVLDLCEGLQGNSLWFVVIPVLTSQLKAFKLSLGQYFCEVIPLFADVSNADVSGRDDCFTQTRQTMRPPLVALEL